MRLNLDGLEIRILACLMEKELTTPENYPLSMNSLLAACNQKSNREPVMTLTEGDIARGLRDLGSRGLARLTTTGGRVPRYCHSVAEKLGLAPQARALLAELMLRGPQTPGELRNRADRMADFPDLAAVETTLAQLQQFGPPLVARLPRQPGRKEQRYAQLLGGAPEMTEMSEVPEEEALEQGRESSTEAAAVGGERVAVGGRKAAPANNRLVQLEAEVASLRDEITSLRQEIKDLLAAFG